MPSYTVHFKKRSIRDNLKDLSSHHIPTINSVHLKRLSCNLAEVHQRLTAKFGFLEVTVEKLKKYGMSSAKPCSTPMALHPPFDVGDLCSIENAQSYRGVIGTLHYLTFNRPDLFLCPYPIFWGAKKQTTVSHSSTEAECRALAITVAEVCWLRQILKDLQIFGTNPPRMLCDNNSAIQLARNPAFHGPDLFGELLAEERMEDAAIKGAISKDHWSRDHTEGMRARPLHFGEPIAARLGVDYPFPPHLEYAYPPPDGNILTNIVNALIAVPRFYTQVLHLMNKMNIPAPFRLPLPTPPLPPSTPAPPSPSLTLPPLPPPATSRSQVTNMPSDESEMESSEEDVEGKYNSSGVSKTAKSGYKRPRCETIVGPGIDKDVAHEAVGVKPSTLVPKEIPMIKKKNPVIQIRIAPKVIHDGKVDKTNNDGEGAEKEADDLKPYATLEDLERGKLPPEEILSLPMFKERYEPLDAAIFSFSFVGRNWDIVRNKCSTRCHFPTLVLKYLMMVLEPVVDVSEWNQWRGFWLVVAE
ncbi:U11/U12 small nuclear ribonucleoprotein 65 kDa protein isoform X1 [Cucumis melo var. makuwa]|uniref:U11/U12 small nuclear ribonucleoprotein 65 kDa protein isoform X1 n=1 Tax=Cucumis melo var. makuwa TaxID=1194695 RepID=A0A5D3CT62_CUCMM|nr:U11/U12 small nuclear ribonucleoprotein 65 kDa protein isoform X1 [Cucumis melo var. makuwa]